VRPGRYRHFKGADYIVVCVARHSETEEELVVYHPADDLSSFWARPICMWDETVEADGGITRRFAHLVDGELDES
jgi:hypothetical protein